MPRRCPICRSKTWHKDARGLVSCSEGHVMQNYIPESIQHSEPGPHALRRRTLKTARDREGRGVSRADAGLYHGPRARWLYFECLQLLLRKQTAALTREWRLPREFETVCRDVWALHLSLLPRPPDPGVAGVYTGEGQAEGESEGSSGEREEDKSDSVSSSSSSSEDSLLESLLREASESEHEDPPSDVDPDRRDKGKRRAQDRHVRPRNRYEQPVGNVAVLMLACWIMRVPAMYADIIRLIDEYKLPYLDCVRELPADMRRHLAKETVGMLSPRFAPGVLTVHRLTTRLARLLRDTYGVETGEGNSAPVLWRVVRGMGGTATLYALTKRVACTLDLSLSLTRAVRGRRRWRDSVPVEAALAAAVIVVLKLVYGLDGERRTGADNDPACALPPVEDYMKSIVHDHTHADSERDYDAEMDLAERALLGQSNDSVLDVFFPLCNVESVLRTPKVPHCIDHPSGYDPPPSDVLSPNPPVLPAACTRIYSSSDLLGHLPPHFSAVLHTASTLLHIPSPALAAVVESYERRLVRIKVTNTGPI
ncbi:hypothetical protein JB92DRAFT_2760060 [Gautieria morchelliformis]|nr:hypothetical protein JB92DRAFT_2760060 [Gautieria morchelliformis]